MLRPALVQPIHIRNVIFCNIVATAHVQKHRDIKRLDIRVRQILGQIKFEEEYSVIRCRDPTFNIKS